MLRTFKSSKATLNGESVCRVTIVDDCSFGRIGLQRSLLEYENGKRIDASVFETLRGPEPVIHSIKNGGESTLARGDNHLIIRLSKSPLDALASLLSMGRMPLDIYSDIVVLSHVEPDFLKRIFLGAGLNRTVKILDDRLPTSVLCKAITQQNQIGCSLQENYFGATFQPSYIFSPGELRALWYIINEVPMHNQVMHSGVSSKTLYNQRYTALIKLRVRDVNDLISRLLNRRIFSLHDIRL